MKTYIKLQGRVGKFKQHSEKFATASVQIGEKDQKGEWHNAYVNLKIFNPTEAIEENVDYTITGSLGVSPAYQQYPEKITVNVKTIERSDKKDSNYTDPVAAANPANDTIPM